MAWAIPYCFHIDGCARRCVSPSAMSSCTRVKLWMCSMAAAKSRLCDNGVPNSSQEATQSAARMRFPPPESWCVTPASAARRRRRGQPRARDTGAVGDRPRPGTPPHRCPERTPTASAGRRARLPRAQLGRPTTYHQSSLASRGAAALSRGLRLPGLGSSWVVGPTRARGRLADSSGGGFRSSPGSVFSRRCLAARALEPPPQLSDHRQPSAKGHLRRHADRAPARSRQAG